MSDSQPESKKERTGLWPFLRSHEVLGHEGSRLHISHFSCAIISRLQDLYKQDYPRFCDVTLMCNDNKAVQAHRLLLSLVSDYFSALFKHEPDKTEYTVHEFDSSIMHWIVTNVCGANDYEESNSIQGLDIIELVKAADYFQIKCMMSFLANSREIQNIDNSFAILKMSESIEIPSIESSYIKHVNENLKEFHQNNKLEALSTATLHKIFQVTSVPENIDAMTWSKTKLIIIYQVLEAKNELESSLAEFMTKYFRADHLYYFATGDDSTHCTLPEYKIAAFKTEEDENPGPQNHWLSFSHSYQDYLLKKTSKFQAKTCDYNLAQRFPDLCQRILKCLSRPQDAFLWDGLYVYWTSSDRYGLHDHPGEDSNWSIDANKIIRKIKTKFTRIPNHPTLTEPVLKGLVVYFDDGSKEAINMEGEGGSDEDVIELDERILQIISLSLHRDRIYKTISSLCVTVVATNTEMERKHYNPEDFKLFVPKNQDRKSMKEKENVYLSAFDLDGSLIKQMSGIRGQFSELNGVQIISKLDFKLEFFTNISEMFAEDPQYVPGFWPPSSP